MTVKGFFLGAFLFGVGMLGIFGAYQFQQWLERDGAIERCVAAHLDKTYRSSDLQARYCHQLPPELAIRAADLAMKRLLKPF